MAGRSRRNRPRMSLIHSSWAFSWSWHRSEAVEIMAGRFRSSFVIVVVAGIEAAIIWALGGWMIFGNLRTDCGWCRNLPHRCGDHGSHRGPPLAHCGMAQLADHTELAWRSLRKPIDATTRPHAHVCSRRPSQPGPRVTHPHPSLPMGRPARPYLGAKALGERRGAVLCTVRLR